MRSTSTGPKQVVPFHPFLFGTFPILFLYRQNLWGMELGEVVLPLALTLGAIVVLQIALSKLTRRPRSVAIALSVCTLLFFSYGHAWLLTTRASGRLFRIDADIVLGILWVGILSLTIVVLIRTKRRLTDLTRVLNVFALAIFATVALPLASQMLQNRAPGAAARASTADEPVVGEPQGRARDIYYLVFDRYAGGKSLEELFGYENREFLDHLEAKGFQIADDARANYQSTVPSLAASMNMKYLDWIVNELEPGTTSSLPLYEAISNNEATRFLKRQGYRYIHVGSRWDMTRASPLADINVRNDPTSEFTRVFYGTTALLPAMRHGVFGPSDTGSHDLARLVNLRQLDAVADSKRFRGPKFVFAHFALPHPPYAFDRNGGPVDEVPEGVPAKARAYLQQLEYTNKRVTEIVDTLLDVPEEQRPIVILQADEGPYPSFSWRSPKHWWQATNRKLRIKFRILMALHMPGVRSDAVYESLSPVNVFRLVFNEYFDTGLPLLKDEAYVPTDKEREPYVWTRITHRLRDPPRAGPPLYPPRLSVLPAPRREA